MSSFTRPDLFCSHEITQNILVKHRGPNWWVKISDFGATKQIESTALRTQIGTEPYLAPEVRGLYAPSDLDLEPSQTYSLAVDIWSVGAIAFRIAAGRVPFPPNSRELYRYVVVGGPFPSDDSLSAECVAFITSAMSPSPSRRPTAKEAMERPWVRAALVKAFYSDVPETDSSTIRSKSTATAKVSEMSEEASGRWSTFSSPPPVEAEKFSSPPPVDENPRDTVTRLLSMSPFIDESTQAEEEPVWVLPVRYLTAGSTGAGKRPPKDNFVLRLHTNSFQFNDTCGYLTAMLTAPAGGLAFSPDGRRFAVTSVNGAYIWNTATSREGFELSSGRSLGLVETPIRQLVFMDNGRQIITNDAYGGLTTWELDHANRFKRTLDHVYVLPRSRPSQFFSSLSPNGSCLITFSPDHKGHGLEMDIWKINAEGRFQHEQSEYTTRMNHEVSVVHSPGGKDFVVCGLHGLRFYRWARKGLDDRFRFILDPRNSWIDGATFGDLRGRFSSNGRWFIHPMVSLFWRNSKGQWTPVGLDLSHRDQMVAAAFSLDNQWLAVGLRSNTITIWKLGEGNKFLRVQNLRFQPQVVMVDQILNLEFSPSGLVLASAFAVRQEAEDDVDSASMRKMVVIWEKS